MTEVISYAEAKAAGLRHYFTGKPCSNGGLSLRRVSDRKCICVNCTKSKTEKSRSRKVAIYQQRRDEFLSVSSNWARENRDRKNARQNAWREANADKVIASHAKRRASKLNATPSWYGELDEFVMREAADLCLLRELATGIAWQVDHMVPLQAKLACGLHCAANVQVIPAYLNNQKLNRMLFTEPFEWMGAN